MIKSIQQITIIFSLWALSLLANANSFSNVFIFGDSLSDIGNLQSVQPSIPARATNGPVAVEILAGGLGHTLTPSLHLVGAIAGNNFAVAGAKSIDEDGDETTPDINLPTQVNAFLQFNGGVVPADALYVVLIGGNDIRAAREVRVQTVMTDGRSERRALRKQAKSMIKSSVAAEIAQIEKLIAAGAQHILVSTAPDIGIIPETSLITAGLLNTAETKKQTKRASKVPQAVSKLSGLYNKTLEKQVKKLARRSNVDIALFNLTDYLTDVIDNAEDFGLTNTEDACIWIFSQNAAVNPECTDFPTASGFLFWDEIHPTTQIHQGAGLEMLESLSH